MREHIVRLREHLRSKKNSIKQDNKKNQFEIQLFPEASRASIRTLANRDHSTLNRKIPKAKKQGRAYINCLN
jgi:hypothetical protein